VAHFELDAERRLLDISEALLAGTWHHGPYRVLSIHDPKERRIAVASVGDRVVHRAVHDTLAPHFERSYIADSYACLPGRGSHRAVLRFLELQRRFPWLLHLDVERHFPSVDHEILLHLLARRLRDGRLVELLGEILRSGQQLYLRPAVAAFYGVDREEQLRRPRGLPIGNLTSQWWGNFYLDACDHFIKRQLKVPGYLRYMDDMVLFAPDRASLRSWRREVGDWLWEQRRLRLNLRKGHIRSAALSHTWLGYRITPQGYDLGPRAVRRFRQQLPALLAGNPERLRRSLAAWQGAMGF